MYLKRLLLENIRCFPHLELDFDLEGGFNRKWTVLLGENGTGKSTVLRSIALMLSGSDALPEIFGDSAYWVRSDATTAHMELDIETKEGEARHLELTINPGDSISRIISESVRGMAPLNNALEHASRSYFAAGYGATRRLGGLSAGSERPSRFRHPRARAVATLFDRDIELNPLESWAIDLDYREAEGLGTVRDVLSDFLPGLEFEGIDKRRKRLMFKTPDGTVPLGQLSEGYQNVAAWVGDLLYRVTETFEDYKTPLQARGVLIIDEIDLHLHPVWQRQLISFLDRRLPNLQLVVTTHSAVTAQQAGPDSIHILKRLEQGVEIERFRPDPGELLINQLLMTDAFGLSTDESVDVETRKARYATLREKDKLSSTEKIEFEGIAAGLGSLEGAAPSRPALHERQVAFLQRLESELVGGPTRGMADTGSGDPRR